MTATGMNLHFCDLCNESIPQADLDQGRAKRRGERLICAACEAAMSPAPERPAPVAPMPPPPTAFHPAVHAAGASASPALAVALAFSSVALLVAVGAGAYLFWQLDQRSAELRGELRDLSRAAPEAARTVAAALEEEAGSRERDFAALETRIQELERGERTGADVARRVADVELRLERLGDVESRLDRVDDLARSLEHQAGSVDRLTGLVTQLAEQAPAAAPSDASAPATPSTEAEVAATPAEPPPVAAGANAGAAGWDGWLADLASPDSGTRWQAVQSLGGTKDPAVVPHLVRMLDDADIFVRMAACRHLGDLGSVEAIPGLIDALEDEEAAVREAALVSLRGLSGQSIPFDPLARDGERAKRVRAWRDWWDEASKQLLPGGRRTDTKG